MRSTWRWLGLTLLVCANMGISASRATADELPRGYCSTCSGSNGDYACCKYSAVCDPQGQETCCNKPSECSINPT